MAITVLSMDPGTTNYAASVLKIATVGEQVKIKVIGTRMVGKAIMEPKYIVPQVRSFQSEIWNLEYHHGPFDLVCAERFQSRGLKGTTIESINMMLGVLAVTFPQLEIYTASTWKNSANRVFDLKATYEELKAVTKPRAKADRRTVHELDCTFMGIYHACKNLDVDPFRMFDSGKRVSSFIQHVDASAKL